MSRIKSKSELEEALHKLERIREDRINRYIIPIEIKLHKIQDQLDNLNLQKNENKKSSRS